MRFHPDAGVGEHAEADGVGLGESVEGEGADGVANFVLNVRRDLARGHGGAEFLQDALHAFFGAVKAH